MAPAFTARLQTVDELCAGVAVDAVLGALAQHVAIGLAPILIPELIDDVLATRSRESSDDERELDG